jgi:hypothetical protein
MESNNYINLDQLNQKIYAQYAISTDGASKRNFSEYVKSIDAGLYVTQIVIDVASGGKITKRNVDTVAVNDWNKFLFSKLKYGW